MEIATREAITTALDKAIAETGQAEFQRLCEGLTDVQVLEKTYSALCSLKGLRGGEMPEYDEWDALFYVLWYQPEHINLAYTLAQRRLEQDQASIQQSGGLEVSDFGCGALAMQFGLALATAATLEAGQYPPALTVTSSDASQPMLLLGRKLWDKFIREITIGGYPSLARVQRACGPLRFALPSGWTETPAWVHYSSLSKHASILKNNRWLTALHVAYEDIHIEVTRELNDRVSKEKPSQILVTAQPEAFRWAFVPDETTYSHSKDNLRENDLAFEGEFQKTSKFRKQLFVDHVENIPNALSEDAMTFVRNYLTSRPTGWVTSSTFQSSCAVYSRK